MAYKKNTTNLTELLLQCVTQPDSMLSMLEWLCTELMRGSKLKNAGASGTHFYGLDTARYLCVIHSYRLAVGIPHKLADLLREVRAAVASQAFRSGLPDCLR